MVVRGITIAGLLIFAFLVETTWVPWLLPQFAESTIQVTPHFVLLVLFYLSIYLNRHIALLLGFVLGFVHDFLYYGYMIGLYTSGMGLTAYLIGWSIHRIRKSFLLTQFMIALGLFLFDGYVFAIYQLFNLVEESFSWVLFRIILPSLLFNLLVSIIIFIPLHHLLGRFLQQVEQEKQAL